MDCDDGDANVGSLLTAFVDRDGDGYGSFAALAVCALDDDGDGTANYTQQSQDCDDNDPHTYPGAAAQDSTSECLRDSDGDGYGEAGG